MLSFHWEPHTSELLIRGIRCERQVKQGQEEIKLFDRNAEWKFIPLHLQFGGPLNIYGESSLHGKWAFKIGNKEEVSNHILYPLVPFISLLCRGRSAPIITVSLTETLIKRKSFISNQRKALETLIKSRSWKKAEEELQDLSPSPLSTWLVVYNFILVWVVLLKVMVGGKDRSE